MESFYSKKLGGENAAELRGSSENIIEDYNAHNSQAIIVSAIRSDEFNTTDHLIKTAEYLSIGDKNSAIYELGKIKKFHIDTVNQQLSGVLDVEELQENINKLFNHVKNVIASYDYTENDLPNSENDYGVKLPGGETFSFIGFGENISAQIYSYVLNAQGVNAEFVDLSNFISSGDLNKPFDLARTLFKAKLSHVFDGDIHTVPVIPGYIGGFPGGIEQNIGRGYSDATASLVALAASDSQVFDKVILNIQKMVDGFMSTDPRALAPGYQAATVSGLNYELASAIISKKGAYAKLLNDQSLRAEVIQSSIEILLNNPFSENPGSLVTHSGDMEANGVNFILKRGAREGSYDHNRFWKAKSLVYLMGQNLGNKAEVFSQASEIMKENNVNYSGGIIDNDDSNSVVFSFNSEDIATRALNILHDSFVLQKQGQNHNVVQVA